MIFTHSYFQIACRPKYLEPVCKLMQKADRAIFLKNKDLEMLITILQRTLEQCRRDGSTAYLSSARSETSGIIQLYAKEHAPDSIARIYFSNARAVMQCDIEAENIVDVSENFVEKGGVQ